MMHHVSSSVNNYCSVAADWLLQPIWTC